MSLCEPEAFASLVDGQKYLLSEHLVRRVLRQVDLVEACNEHASTLVKLQDGWDELTSVRLRQAVNLSVRLVDGEPLDALDTLQLDEATERYSGRASREAEHLRALLAVERLQRTPEPDNDGVGARVAIVLCRSAPLVYVDIGRSRYEQLQLFLVELR